jgi:hypothetical protein
MEGASPTHLHVGCVTKGVDVAGVLADVPLASVDSIKEHDFERLVVSVPKP